MGIHEAGKITHKNDLREYFSKGLEKYPDLHFELYHELCARGLNRLYPLIMEKYVR